MLWDFTVHVGCLQTTWWLIPLSKWVITLVISGLTLLIPFITGVITHLLSGMSHQAGCGTASGRSISPALPERPAWRSWGKHHESGRPGMGRPEKLSFDGRKTSYLKDSSKSREDLWTIWTIQFLKSLFIQWSVADLCWPRTPTDSIGETCHTGCEGRYNTLVGVRGHRICQEPVPDPWEGPLTPSQLSGTEGMCCIFWHGTANGKAVTGWKDANLNRNPFKENIWDVLQFYFQMQVSSVKPLIGSYWLVDVGG